MMDTTQRDGYTQFWDSFIHTTVANTGWTLEDHCINERNTREQMKIMLFKSCGPFISRIWVIVQLHRNKTKERKTPGFINKRNRMQERHQTIYLSKQTIKRKKMNKTVTTKYVHIGSLGKKQINKQPSGFHNYHAHEWWLRKGRWNMTVVEGKGNGKEKEVESRVFVTILRK